MAAIDAARLAREISGAERRSLGMTGDLDPLAEACQQQSRWEFFCSISPLRLTGTTGSPVNPLAIF